MANATLSPKQLAALLSMLDDAQRRISSIRQELIQAMAARRLVPTAGRQAQFVRRKRAPENDRRARHTSRQ
jgi:hypothetical protein